MQTVRNDTFACAEMVFSELAHVPLLPLSWRGGGWRALTRRLNGGPARIGRALQAGRAGDAALPELSAALLRQGRLTGLL